MFIFLFGASRSHQEKLQLSGPTSVLVTRTFTTPLWSNVLVNVDWNIGTVLLENHFMSTCQYCTRRNKSKMTRLSNHMLREAVQHGYAGWTRISEVLTRLSCSVSCVSKLILLKKMMGSFHSFIPNCHCHGYNILSLRDCGRMRRKSERRECAALILLPFQLPWKSKIEILTKSKLHFYQGSLFYGWEEGEKPSDKESACLLLN